MYFVLGNFPAALDAHFFANFLAKFAILPNSVDEKVDKKRGQKNLGRLKVFFFIFIRDFLGENWER